MKETISIFPQGIKNYIKYCQMEEGDRPYTSRYIGSLVSDFHRNMIKGGIYMYPKVQRLVMVNFAYFMNAIQWLFWPSRLMGKPVMGLNRIMEIEPTELHQRVPFICGSKNMVEKAEEFMRNAQ
jgi:fructose-1,6-bisphosphatase I